MNTEKKLERYKRMNVALNEELEKLQKKYDEALEEANAPIEEIVALMQELRDIESEWAIALKDIQNYRDEYAKLIDDLRDLRKQVRKGKVHVSN